jgi:hypothetical protein
MRKKPSMLRIVETWGEGIWFQKERELQGIDHGSKPSNFELQLALKALCSSRKGFLWLLGRLDTASLKIRIKLCSYHY